MAIAMEARCYVGGAGRTRLVQLHARPVDYAVTLCMLVFVVGVWFGTDVLVQQFISHLPLFTE
jgi:energy-coupling factor transporter transmembrane protein EcfT